MSRSPDNPSPTFDDSDRRLRTKIEEQKQCEREVAIIRSEVDRISALYDEKQTELRAADNQTRVNKIKEAELFDANDIGFQMDIERRRQETEREIKDLVHDMGKKRIPLYSAQVSEHKEEKRSFTTLFVHSVKVSYIKNLKDGDIERFTKSQARMAVFRITKDTTLHELKKTVCNFWVGDIQGIEHPDLMSLRANNMAYLGLLDKEDDHVIDGQKESSMPLHRLLSENRVYPELWLIENNSETTRLFPNQEDFCKSYSDEKDYSKMKQKAANQHSVQGDKANYSKFLEQFPGLRSLLPPKMRTDKVKENDEESTLDRDTSCPTFTIMMLIIILTTVVIVARLDSNETYWEQFAVTSKLTTLFDGYGYNNMASVEDLILFTNQVIPAILFPQYPFVDGIMQAIHLVGPVRFRQLRTQSTDCATQYVALESNSHKCYFTEYSDSTRETADLLTGEMPWMRFQSASETGISSTYTGFLSVYDGSGYVMDYYGNTTSADFLVNQANMLKSNWIDSSTRALFLTFTLYDPTTDHWLFFNNAIELGTCGAIIPTALTPKVFRPNMYETAADKSISAADVLRFILSFYFWVITANEVASRGSGRWKFRWMYFLSANFIRDLITFLLILIGFALANTLKLDTSSILRNNQFYDFSSAAQVFRVSIQINIISVIFVFMRLLLVLQTIHSAWAVLQSMSKTLGRIVAYLMLLSPLIMGLAVASVNIWGSYLSKFHTVQYAFISNVLLSVGMVDALQMYMINSVWTVIFILVSLLVWTFYIIAVFKGIYLDSRMAIRQKLGYGEKRVGSGFGKFAWWLLGFLPKRVIRKLVDWSEKRKEQKAEEENIKKEKLKAEKEQESKAHLDSIKDAETGRQPSGDQAEHST